MELEGGAAGGGRLAMGGTGGRGLPDGGDRMVPAGHHHGEGGGGGEEDQPHPPRLCVGWGGETAKWPNAAKGETVGVFLCLFGMSEPPQRKNIFFEGVLH